MRWKDHVNLRCSDTTRCSWTSIPWTATLFIDQYREVVKLDVDVGKFVEASSADGRFEEDMFDLMENWGGMQFDSEGNLLICGGKHDTDTYNADATAAFAYIVRPNGAVTDLMASQSWNPNVGPSPTASSTVAPEASSSRIRRAKSSRCSTANELAPAYCTLPASSRAVSDATFALPRNRSFY